MKRLLVICLAIGLAAIGISACGGGSSSSSSSAELERRRRRSDTGDRRHGSGGETDRPPAKKATRKTKPSKSPTPPSPTTWTRSSPTRRKAGRRWARSTSRSSPTNTAKAPKAPKSIPGLAKELPKVTNGGKTYTLFLRPGLKYSDGKPVKASDFPYAVERLFKVNSGGSPFYTTHRRRRKVRQNQEGRHPRDQNQRQDRRNPDHPRKAARHLRKRAGADVRGAGPEGHAERRPLGQPAPRHRPLHAEEREAGQRLGIRT